MDVFARILRRLGDRLQALAEIALAEAFFAWLLYGLPGGWLDGLAGGWPGGPGLAALLLALAPTFAWVRWRRARSARAMEDDWAELDRGDAEALLGAAERLDARAPLLGTRRRRSWSRRLAAALSGTGPVEGEAARRLLSLLEDGGAESPEALARSLHSLPESRSAGARLALWNRVEAGGGPLDAVRVDGLFDSLRGRPLGRDLPRWLPLALARARAGAEPARSLLVAALNQRRLRAGRLPADLRESLLAHEALDPRLRPRAAAPPPAPRVIHAEAPAPAAGVPAEPRAPRPPRPPRPPRKTDRRLLARVAGGLALVALLALASRWLAAPSREAADVPAPSAGRLLYHEGDGDGGFTVQVMASKDSLQARRTTAALRETGVWAYLLGPRPNSSWYRVRFGRFERRAQADSVAGRLKEEQRIEAWYVANYEADGIIFGREADGR